MNDHLKDSEILQRDVDKIIDAQESGNYRAGSGVIQVKATEQQLAFAYRGPDGHLHYRGRILQPIGKPKPVSVKKQQVDAWGK